VNVNEQELPEDGTASPVMEEQAHATDESLNESAAMAEEQVDVSDAFGDDDVDGDDLNEDLVDDEEGLSEDELGDDEEIDLDDDRVRTIVEQFFEDDDLGEVMSELDVLTLEDAAAYLKVEYGQIRRLIKEQALPGRKIGDEWRFLRGALADWLRAPGGQAPASVPANATAERPATPDRRDFSQKPPLRERFSQEDDNQQQRFPQQGGGRYPQQGGRPPQRGGYQQGGYQQGGSRYPQQEGRPPRRSQNEFGGYQGGQGNQGYRGYQGGEGQGQDQGPPPQGAGGGYPPPRRPRFGQDQDQQPQGEYRPPRRPYGQGNQGGGGYSGGGSGSAGGQKYNSGPKKPKRKSLNEQRFNRLDRRKGGEEADQGGAQDSDE
jgi:excisionase family DNA binding protein